MHRASSSALESQGTGALPATEQELAEFNSSATRFSLTADGVEVVLIESEHSEVNGLAYRRWEYPLAFGRGSHTLVGRWMLNAAQIQLTTVTVRASG